MMTNRKNRRLWVTIALLAAAAVLLLISGVNTANAALTYFSEDYKAQVEMYDIGVTLTENGDNVSWRDYTGSNDAWHVQLDGILLQNMIPEGEQVHLGQSYPEVIGVRNSGTIDEYVRVKLYRYWTDTDGNKLTELQPGWIDLNITADGWVIDESATTDERTVLYYTSILESGKETSALTDTLTINGELAAKVTTETTTNAAGTTVITTTYDYDGVQFNIEAEVDAVQTHNAEDAIKSAWGVDVSIGSDGSLALR